MAVILRLYMSDKEQLLSRIIDKISKVLPQQGSTNLIDGITCIKITSSESISCPTIYNPAVIYLINGQKECSIGEKTIAYSSGEVFVNTLNMPANFKILDASEQNPHIALKVNIDTNLLAKVMTSNNYKIDPNYYKDQLPPMAFTKMESGYYDLSVLDRMLDLRLGNFTDVYPYLLQKRELYYHWLKNERLAPMIAHFVVRKTIVIVKAIDYINRNYTKSIAVDDLAKLCAMSSSNFFKHFKEVTAMSPLQYIRRKRLLEARRMLTSFKYKAVEVSNMVGYNSEQQFSRDYSKFFGVTPKQDSLNHIEQAL